jgi:hypothetical protein
MGQSKYFLPNPAYHLPNQLFPWLSLTPRHTLAAEPVRGGPLYCYRYGERKSLYPEDRSVLTGQRRVVDYDAVGAAAGETLSEQLDFSNWT